MLNTSANNINWATFVLQNFDHPKRVSIPDYDLLVLPNRHELVSIQSNQLVDSALMPRLFQRWELAHY